MSITPKNWAAFQHYKDRSPAWIKLHRGLLDDFAFSRLPVASRALAPLLWLLASEGEDGAIGGSLDEIAFRLHSSVDELATALKPLIDGGFFIDNSGLLAARKQEAIPERETQGKIEEQEKEEPSLRSGDRSVDVSRAFSDWPTDYREQFWDLYPRKQAKKAALKALERIRKSGEVKFDRLLAGVRKIPINEPIFIPHPASWLNDGRWDDENVPGRGPPARAQQQPSFHEIAAEIRSKANGTVQGPSDNEATILEGEPFPPPVRSFG